MDTQNATQLMKYRGALSTITALARKRNKSAQLSTEVEAWLWYGCCMGEAAPMLMGEHGIDPFTVQSPGHRTYGSAAYFYSDVTIMEKNSVVFGISSDALLAQAVLALVAVGRSQCRQPDAGIKHPDAGFDSVTGVVKSASVTMIYDSGHAYPAYLVTFQRSSSCLTCQVTSSVAREQPTAGGEVEGGRGNTTSRAKLSMNRKHVYSRFRYKLEKATRTQHWEAVATVLAEFRRSISVDDLYAWCSKYACLILGELQGCKGTVSVLSGLLAIFKLTLCSGNVESMSKNVVLNVCGVLKRHGSLTQVLLLGLMVLLRLANRPLLCPYVSWALHDCDGALQYVTRYADPHCRLSHDGKDVVVCLADILEKLARVDNAALVLGRDAASVTIVAHAQLFVAVLKELKTAALCVHALRGLRAILGLTFVEQHEGFGHWIVPLLHCLWHFDVDGSIGSVGLDVLQLLLKCAHNRALLRDSSDLLVLRMKAWQRGELLHEVAAVMRVLAVAYEEASEDELTALLFEDAVMQALDAVLNVVGSAVDAAGTEAASGLLAFIMTRCEKPCIDEDLWLRMQVTWAMTAAGGDSFVMELL